MPRNVILDGHSLVIEDVAAVAAGVSVALAPTARTRMQQSRAVVDAIVARGAIVYGITTGFGKLSDVAIPLDHLADLQVNLLRSHAAGVGPLLAEREVRGMMVLRANVLAKGYSGCRPELVDLLIGMLNGGLYPPVPEQGSVGASGDLAPLAHLGRSLIGEGDLLRQGRTGPAAMMLAEAGLVPATLGPKEGLALINGTQAHTAIAALSIDEGARLWRAAHIAGAMSLEALLGTPVAFDERVHAARGQLGQQASAALLRKLLASSQIRESHRFGDSRVQDAYALRCMPQIHGPVCDALRFARDLVGRELNAATDNPLVLEDGTLLSGGNFHGQVVAMALDVLAIAITNLGVISERRIDRLVNPDLNQGLPAFLARDAGLHSGFMIAQVSAAALTSECKVLAHPASVDSIPTDGGKEDVVPMAMTAAWKLRRILHNVRHILAIELMCAAQGVDYRAPLRPGQGVAHAHSLVRALVEPLTGDRALSADIARLADAVSAGTFDVVTGAVADTAVE